MRDDGHRELATEVGRPLYAPVVRIEVTVRSITMARARPREFRDRRQERREERRGGGGADHYRMRQKLVSIGDDYWIENDRGERAWRSLPGRTPW